MKKRKDECALCKSRSCYDRVISLDETFPYDEVACFRHKKEIHALHDNIKLHRRFIHSTGKLVRGELFTP